MKIMITLPVADMTKSDFLRLGNIVHRPDLAGRSEEHLLEELAAHGADGLITARRPAPETLAAWRRSGPGRRFLAYTIGIPPRDAPDDLAELQLTGGDLAAVGDALRWIERQSTLGRLPHPPHGSRPVDPPRSRDVVLIGAGIVNLITALALLEDGFRITVLDGSPAPSEKDWQAYGCTHAGDDARMFTLTEMDDYSNQDPFGRPLDLFRVPVDRCGWRAYGDRPLSPAEQDFLRDYERIPSWLARGYNDDIFGFAAEALDGWRTLQREHPELFAESALTHGILRLYGDRDHLAASLERHRRIGALQRELTNHQLVAEYPGLAHAIGEGELAGGFLALGFTVNVHKFCRALIERLESLGAVFQWDTTVAGVQRDARGTVTGLDAGRELPPGAHVVASPGAYGHAVLAGSACEAKIHGVLGGWSRISNASVGLSQSLKVARKGHVTEDANITVAVDGDGRDVLIVGSGYGYLGEAVEEPDQAQLDTIRLGIADTITRLFPGHGPLPASADPADNYGFKYCVRPWTATSLGLYHAEATAWGSEFVINGGHNTGGFAQSPAVAGAVLATLRGEHHPMHALYHPRRLAAFADDRRS
ncbi:FAD-binding oxidoreductase [Kitasatospora sp. NBC_01250]|uniref:NAD(P)/FAD-dependent oxidoreductase n=1 Tax=unclassified Kitasatospora TaxID=2633591 RepID=UPI002E0E3B18|nr:MULTISPECIES: FAD-dependent oxidoreductase [unclassified Kitasatospora]WSJ70274.1 FAD-binding oxidoreductase [Kitasatospora sp. NBC_01302]